MPADFVWLNLMLKGFLPSSAAACIYLFKPAYDIGQSRGYRVTQLRTDGVHCRESAGTGPVNLKVVPNGCRLGRDHGPINMCLSFPHPLLVSSGHVESTLAVNAIDTQLRDLKGKQ